VFNLEKKTKGYDVKLLLTCVISVSLFDYITCVCESKHGLSLLSRYKRFEVQFLIRGQHY